MVQVGEMTGMLDQTFLRPCTPSGIRKRHVCERIKGAVRYPMFVVIAMAIAIVIVNIFRHPTFAKVFAGFHAELPLMTKILMGFSNFMVNYWPLLLAMIIGAVVAFRRGSIRRMVGTNGTVINSNYPSPARSSSRARWHASRAVWRCRSRAASLSCKVWTRWGWWWTTNTCAARSSRCVTA